MNVAIGADHGGTTLKKIIIGFLKEKGHGTIDLGAQTYAPGDDYPDYARAVAMAIRQGKAERGILICGSGVGASVAANKFPGVRAAVCHDSFSAHQGVEDDDMNVLCLGERIIGPELAKEVAGFFLSARFSLAERHVRRLGKVKDIEKEFMKT
ncbi:MAG: ribose 5-phosphate isomerase B [Nitrospiraceae bacterium]|nr:MAG: ribose 5-phosphate isomerase B [Nitrospiraceae bacterium]